MLLFIYKKEDIMKIRKILYPLLLCAIVIGVWVNIFVLQKQIAQMKMKQEGIEIQRQMLELEENLKQLTFRVMVLEAGPKAWSEDDLRFPSCREDPPD